MNNLWAYDEAFSRHRGIINVDEQKCLQTRRVAIAGMGGIGGIDLITLARLGIGKFTIADPDRFELANINRQYGATVSTIGRYKAEVMAEIVWDINPDADIRIFTESIGNANAVQFMQDADIFVDAIEVFEIDARRLLFCLAATQGIWGITAGPIGFSAVWLVFDPNGMTFDRYFDLSNDMNALEKLVTFIVGVAPKASQSQYLDLREINIVKRTGPSSGLACHIAAGILACELIKILLNKGKVQAVPYYNQFDPFVGRYIHGYLRGGNRNPWQKIKRKMLMQQLKGQLSAKRIT